MESIATFLSDFIFNAVITQFSEKINEILIGYYQSFLNMTNQMVSAIGSDSLMESVADFCCNISLAMFGIGVILSIYDFLEAMAADKAVSPYNLLKSWVFGFAFSIFGGRIVLWIFDFAISLMAFLDLSVVTSEMGSHSLDSLTSDVGMVIVFTVILLIGSIVFIFRAATRWVQALVQVIQVPLFVLPIMRGDDTAFSSWGRATLAVALTFFVEYFLYWCGLTFLLTGYLMEGIACFIGCGGVSTQLGKYGMSKANNPINFYGASCMVSTVKSVVGK